MMILTVIALISRYYILSKPIEECRTIAVLVFLGVSLVVLLRVAIPFNKFKLLLVFVMAAASFLCFIIPLARMIFGFTTLSLNEYLIALACIAISWPMIKIGFKLASFIGEKIKK